MPLSCVCDLNGRGGTPDLPMTDVPDLVRVAVVAPIGNSDNSSLSAVISMAQAVPNLCVMPGTQYTSGRWCTSILLPNPPNKAPSIRFSLPQASLTP